MKFTIDTEKKEITLTEVVGIKELFQQLDEMFGEEMYNYTLIQKPNYSLVPVYPYYPSYPSYHTTCVVGGGGMGATANTTSKVN
jgi:hypothetical protein